MLIVSGSIIYTATKVSNKLKAKYPTVDCKMFEDIYEGEIDDWQIEAANEFTANDKLFRDGKADFNAIVVEGFNTEQVLDLYCAKDTMLQPNNKAKISFVTN